MCSLALIPTILPAQTNPERLRNYEQAKRANEELTRLSDEIDRNAKASCYVAVPAPALCHCIMNELGWGVSFQHYVIIRTLPTIAEKTKFVKDSFGLKEDPWRRNSSTKPMRHGPSANVLQKNSTNNSLHVTARRSVAGKRR